MSLTPDNTQQTPPSQFLWLNENTLIRNSSDPTIPINSEPVALIVPS